MVTCDPPYPEASGVLLDLTSGMITISGVAKKSTTRQPSSLSSNRTTERYKKNGTNFVFVPQGASSGASCPSCNHHGSARSSISTSTMHTPSARQTHPPPRANELLFSLFLASFFFSEMGNFGACERITNCGSQMQAGNAGKRKQNTLPRNQPPEAAARCVRTCLF